MPSPFPGMDPFLEKTPIFHELNTQMLACAQRLLQPQVRPKYVARLERHLSEGSVWGMELGSLHRKEPDLTVLEYDVSLNALESPAGIAPPLAIATESLEDDVLELRRQRRIVIYVDDVPRRAVTAIELLSPTNKESATVGQSRYLEKRNSALHGGLHWVEIDLLRGGERPPIPIEHDSGLYSCYIAVATATGWEHRVYGWQLQDSLPCLPIPLLGDDQAVLDLGSCFREAYDAAAADSEAGYAKPPPAPPLADDVKQWVHDLLIRKGLRRS